MPEIAYASARLAGPTYPAFWIRYGYIRRDPPMSERMYPYRDGCAHAGKDMPMLIVGTCVGTTAKG